MRLSRYAPIVALICGTALLLAPAASAATSSSSRELTGRSAITDGALSILVLEQPTQTSKGKVRYSWDMTSTACVQLGGDLAFHAWIGNVDTKETAYESPEITTYRGALDIELPEGHYIAEADPWSCTYESEDQGMSVSETGNAWVVDFTLGACRNKDDQENVVVSFLEGKGSVTFPDGTTLPLSRDLKIPAGSKITTDPLARVELRTCQGAAARVGPMSQLTLTKAYFGPVGKKVFSAKLFFGMVWTKISGVLGPGSRFEMETRSGGGDARGTTWCTSADTVGGKPRSVFRVVDGTVAVTSATTRKTVLVRAGYFSQIIGNASPTPPKRMPPAMIPTEATCQ